MNVSLFLLSRAVSRRARAAQRRAAARNVLERAFEVLLLLGKQLLLLKWLGPALHHARPAPMSRSRSLGTSRVYAR